MQSGVVTGGHAAKPTEVGSLNSRGGSRAVLVAIIPDDPGKQVIVAAGTPPTHEEAPMEGTVPVAREEVCQRAVAKGAATVVGRPPVATVEVEAAEADPSSC
jgi:hypothetical protein